MKKDNNTLKSYFETGDYPSEVQFADLIDSFLNIEEQDAVTGITDNGDGTYTFQLLSGSTETLDVQSLPNDIPISAIVGLQTILDAIPTQYLRKNQDDTMDGVLTVTNRVVTSRIDTHSGQQLVLNAGESAGQATGQTNEYIYLNSEQGIEINSSPDNWGSGWAGRETTHISGSEIKIKSSNTKLSVGGGNSLRMTTGTGYIEVGSQNTSHCHFYTDRSNFYFNKELRIDTGIVSSYNEDLVLTRAGSSQDRLRVTTGYCISDQNFLIYAADSQPLSIRGSSNDANTPCYMRFEKLDGTDRSYIGYGSSSNSHLYIVNQEGTDCYLMLKTNGEAEFNNNVRADNFILSSDSRLKTNIKPLEKSMNLDFVEFEMKKNKGEKRYGVIAQEVEENHPELVFTDEEGMKQVKYIDLLVAKVAELEKRLAVLENN
ncbi:tail fiber domain-containing protein [Flagellimonas aurea]|uniref:tail fiber domain-containing protein n=1 Tax=Flagellimonas aurea TaxID=2915619 RepID=UPI0035CED6F4